MRSAKNRDLPENLYARDGSGRRWRYINPVTGERKNFTASREDAKRAVRQANSILAEEGLSLVGGTTFAAGIKRFRAEYLDTRKISASTRKDKQIRLEVLIRQFGRRPTQGMQVKELADFIDSKGGRTGDAYRQILIELFDWFEAKGLAEWNPARTTLRPEYSKQRERWTLETYQATWGKASFPIQNAMSLALQTLQRRSDIAHLRRHQIRDGVLTLAQQKTGKQIALEICPELAAILERCNDRMLSEYIIHQPYDAGKHRRGRPLSPESLSRGVSAARNKAGLDMPHPPTFHEIRSLGAHLYREAGKPEPWIQMLLGHEDKEMTEHYLKGHAHVIRITGAGLRV